MPVMTQGNAKASKLSPTQVQEIRRLYQAGGWSQGALAREFCISVVQIGRIVRGEVWQHLPATTRLMSEGELQAAAERLLKLQEEVQGQTKLQQVAQETLGPAKQMLDEIAGIPPNPLDEE